MSSVNLFLVPYMYFWKNVSRLLRERDMSIRSLATLVRVTPGAISKYSRGTSPSLDIAQRIARVLDVSLDYLVSGPDDQPPGGPFCRDPAAHAVIGELGLEELLLVHKLGSTGLAWEISTYLAARHPEPVAESTIRRHLQHVDKAELQGQLVALRRQGVIACTESREGESSYSLTRAGAVLRAKSPGDLSWHAYQAVKHLLRVILPAVERQDETGHLLTFTASVPQDEGEHFARELRQFIRDRYQVISARSGGGEITVVVGVAIEPRSS